MSNQPKPRKEDAASPTGAPDCIFCGRPPHPDSYGHSYRPGDQPTGEWTLTPRALHFNIMCGDTVIYEGVTSEIQGNKLADAHNAALTALVDYWQGVATQEWREGFASGTDLHSESRIAVDQAELRMLREKVGDLETQLAAEREKGLTLVEALKQALSDVETSNDPISTCSKIRTALAKVGK